MNKLTPEMFRMQINSMCIYFKQQLKPDIVDNDYWPYFKKYDGKRFAECVTWLKENYDNTYRFPLIADFRTAWHATHKTVNEVVKPEKIDRAGYSKLILGLAEKFRVHSKDSGDITGGVKSRQWKLYKRMLKENKVFSYKRYKWVDRTLMGNVGGDFILPEDKL